jgi:hypothetical protein
MSCCRLTATVLLSLFLVLFFLPHVALSAPITVPTSLSPGDQYRLAFVTSTTRDALSSNIADYNTFVSNAANAVPELLALLTTWKAIASTSSVAARVNTGTVPSFAGGSLGVPIFLLNDTKLVDSNDDLWDGNLDVPLNRTEFGSLVDAGVWTGSYADGSPSFPDVLGSFPSVLGFSSYSDSGWVHFIEGNSFDDFNYYALSAPLTVPSSLVVPEPSTLCLLAVGICLLGIISYRQRRRKTA